jgi:hypothetical protein
MGHKGYLYGWILFSKGLDPGGQALTQVAYGLTPIKGGKFDDRPEFVHQGQGHAVIDKREYTVGFNLDCVVSIRDALGKGDRCDSGLKPPVGLPLEFQFVKIIAEDKVPRIDPHRTQFP